MPPFYMIFPLIFFFILVEIEFKVFIFTPLFSAVGSGSAFLRVGSEVPKNTDPKHGFPGKKYTSMVNY